MTPGAVGHLIGGDPRRGVRNAPKWVGTEPTTDATRPRMTQPHKEPLSVPLRLCGENRYGFGVGAGVVMLGTLRAESSGTGTDSDGLATVSDD
jgi:hypothetical protein